jgi:hypothetical protein
MLEVRYQKMIYREDLRDHPKSLYIFGDNVARVGMGGQAKHMRGEPNAFGIVTKLAPTYNPDDFMKDTEAHAILVQKDFILLLMNLRANKYYETLVIPQDGIGTGIAALKDNAPQILEYINKMLFDVIPNEWPLQLEENNATVPLLRLKLENVPDENSL